MTPQELFSKFAYIVGLKAKDFKPKLANHAYQLQDLMQEGFLCLWKTVQKDQVLHSPRPETLKGYLSTVIYRHLAGLKKHTPLYSLEEN